MIDIYKSLDRWKLSVVFNKVALRIKSCTSTQFGSHSIQLYRKDVSQTDYYTDTRPSIPGTVVDARC